MMRAKRLIFHCFGFPSQVGIESGVTSKNWVVSCKIMLNVTI